MDATRLQHVRIGDKSMFVSAATISVISKCASGGGAMLRPKELMRLQNLQVPHVVVDDGAVRIESFDVLE